MLKKTHYFATSVFTLMTFLTTLAFTLTLTPLSYATEGDEIVEDNHRNKKAIILVPGFFGSEFYSTSLVSSQEYLRGKQTHETENMNYPKGYRFWVPESISGDWGGISNLANIKRIQADTEMLACDDAGLPIVDLVAADINTHDDLYGAINLYGPVMNKLKSSFSSEYADNIHFFDYDWRLSVKIAAENLEKFVNDNNYSEIILIGYSMGGLVTSLYLANSASNANKVKKLITIGTPYLGAPKAAYVLATGNMLSEVENVIMAAPLKKIFPNFSASYELMPTEKYFLLNDTSYLGIYNKKAGWANGEKKDITNYSDSMDIINTLWCKDRHFIAETENIQDKLFLPNGDHITLSLDSYYIIGTGQETIGKVLINYDESGNYKTAVAISPALQGDGTVPLISANIGQSIPREKSYYINEGHEGLITNHDVLELVHNIIQDAIDGDLKSKITHSEKVSHDFSYDRFQKLTLNEPLDADTSNLTTYP